MVKKTIALRDERDVPLPKDYLGYIDYRVDFEFPASEMSFHWWDKTFVATHYHNHYEIFVITEGKIYHTLNGRRVELSQGNMVLVHPEDRHSFEPANGYNAQHINLAITENKLRAICAMVPDLQRFIDESMYFTTILTESELAYYVNNAQQINLVREQDEPAYEHSATVITLGMIAEALVTMYKRSLAISPQYPEWFNELLQKLHSPEALTCKISDVYAMSNYSPPMLLKYFKEYTGETIVSYFTKIKMNFACNMLRSTNFTVLEIANRLAYDSISHFNKIFKEYTGKTPMQYKKSIAIQPQ